MNRSNLSSSDGTRLAYYTWEPAGTPKGHVVLAHGVAEHLGRYEHVAAALTAAGYHVRGVDFRGHGHSEGKRGHVKRWEEYVHDLRAAIAAMPGPHAIVAHSMGTTVALDHLRDTSPWAFVASGMNVGVAVETPAWKMTAARVLSRLWPSLAMENEIPPSHICTDPAVVEKYLADPLVFSTITPRWAMELLASFERIHAAATHYDTPAYVPYGGLDKIVSTSAIQSFATRYGAEMTLAPYPEMAHEVFNEPGQQQVFEGMIRFLDAHCPETP